MRGAHYAEDSCRSFVNDVDCECKSAFVWLSFSVLGNDWNNDIAEIRHSKWLLMFIDRPLPTIRLESDDFHYVIF